MTRTAHIPRTRPWLAITLMAALLCACHNSGDKTGTAAMRPQAPPRNSSATYDGIDISSHQGFIDWAKVSSDKDIRFVYIKATEGATYHSPHYVHNLTNARRYGVLVGSYHYLTTTSSIDDQFKNFSHYALKAIQDLEPMLDVETRGQWSRAQLMDSVEKFCRLTEQHYGVQPMIYSTMGFYNKNLTPRFNDHHLYIGRYSTDEPEINWQGKYTIWQYTETGIVPGIDAYVDMCRYSDDGWIDQIMLPKERNDSTDN